MKAGRTLQEIATQIKHEQEAKRDFIVPTDKLEFTDYGALRFKPDGHDYEVEPTTHCLRQISERCGIPTRYVERMMAGKAPELLATNINHWFKSEPEPRMVRTLMNGSNIGRAFLSKRYRPLSNHDLAEVVLPVLFDAGCEVLSAEITETRMYIQAVTPKLFVDFTGHEIGDVIQAGAVVFNSEVGLSSIGMEQLLYKVGCKNGMVRREGIRRHHIGRSGNGLGEDASEYFSDATQRLDDKAFWAKVRDVAKGLFQKERFERLVHQFADTKKVRLADSLGAVEEITTRFRLSDTEKSGVINHLIAGGDSSLFGLVNAVTRTSADVESYDRAVELERVGGDIIELPRKLWGK